VVLLVCEGLDGREWANESLQNSAELNVFENSLPNTFLTKKTIENSILFLLSKKILKHKNRNRFASSKIFLSKTLDNTKLSNYKSLISNSL
jgi:hypothetical protein